MARPKRLSRLVASSREMLGTTQPETVRMAEGDGVPIGAAVSDGATFEEFFEALASTLFRRLYLITGDRGEAEEIMQDAFIVLFERWDRVQLMDDPEGYLYRVAFNIQRKLRRKASVAARRSLRIAPPADDFDVVDTRSVVSSALAALTPRQRAALVLTELLGYPSDEAAVIMNVRPSTVRVLAHQGRTAMRKQLGGADE